MIDSNNKLKSLSRALLESAQSILSEKKEAKKDLAKLAPPYDKVTHADVLVGRKVFSHDQVKAHKAKKGIKEDAQMVVIYAPVLGDINGELAEVLKRDPRDKTVHVQYEGMKYILKSGQYKELRTEEEETSVDKFIANADKVKSDNKKMQKHLGLKQQGKPVTQGNVTTTMYNKEEVEDIEELSKPLLGRYIKGALNDKARHEKSSDEIIKARNQVNNISYSSGVRGIKQPKGEKASHEVLNHAAAIMSKAASKHDDKAYNRKYGIHKAMTKLTKEEAESIDEAMKEERVDESTKIAAHLIKRYGDNVRKSHVVSAANDFGVDASKLAKAVRTKLGKTSLAEDDDGWYTHSQIHGSMKSEKHPKGISAAEWKSGIRWHHGKNKRINIKEEAESLDEISKATMGRYINKAKDSIDTASYRQGNREALGGSSRPLERKLSKRHKGISTAVAKLTREEQDFVGSHLIDCGDALDEAINFTALDAVTKGHKNKSYSDIFDAHGSSIHNKMKAVRKERNNQPGTTSHATFLHDRALGAYASWYRNKKAVKEEAKGLDELSHDTLRDYRMKAKSIADNEGGKDRSRGRDLASRKSYGGRMSGISKAKVMAKEDVQLSQEEIDFIEATMSDLEEGRGRPPKEGSAAYKAKMQQDLSDMPALGVQIRKAASINKPVMFMDGQSKHLSDNHINRFHDHMDSHKTSQDKSAFQKRAHKSHDEFVKAVSEPVKGRSKDTGEIVKYK